jgi:hypothetical protein
VIPSQRWPDVPAQVVGLLYQRGQQPWGESLHHAGAFVSDHDLKRTEYAFSNDGSSPYLHNPAHIVELEVNQGRGGRGLHFVATDLRVLDGRDGVPADPTQQLVQVRRRFDALVKAKQAELERVYLRSSKQAKVHADEQEQLIQMQYFKATVEHQDEGERVALAPTWQADTHAIAVIIVYRRAGSVIVHTHRPRSTGGMDHGPQHSQSEFGYGVRVSARYIVDNENEVTLEEVLEVEDASWQTDL